MSDANRQKSLIFRQITPPELKKGELRKLQIVEATIGCLGKVGLSGTNYESVARTAGMKRPHVAYYFPEWSDLLESAGRFVYATGQAIVIDHLRDGSARKEPFARYVEGTFQWLKSHPMHTGVITALWHLATYDARFRKLSTEVKLHGAERVYGLLFADEKIERRGVRWATALSVHAMIVGRCVDAMSTDLPMDIATLVKRVQLEASALTGKLA